MATKIHKIFEYGPNVFGAGPVVYSFSPDMNFIATCGANHNLKVFDRRGNLRKECHLNTSSKVACLDWDSEGDTIAVMLQKSPSIFLWSVYIKDEPVPVTPENGKNITFLRWSKTHPILSFGLDSGAIVVFNKRTQKLVQAPVPHGKALVDADWNEEGLLLSVAKDKSILITRHTGENFFSGGNLKFDAEKIKWTSLKTEDRQENKQQKSFAAVIKKKNLFLFNINSTKQPYQLIFEDKYGQIVDYCLYGDGYIVVAFYYGYICHVSTHSTEMNTELNSERIFQKIDAINVNQDLFKCAVAGENKIKIIDMNSWEEITSEAISLPNNCGRVTSLTWSENGQLLLFATEKGFLYGVLTHLPRLVTTFKTTYAVLTSFSQISVFFTTDYRSQQLGSTLTLEFEPSFLGLGAYYLASGLNNFGYFYRYRGEDLCILEEPELAFENDYFSKILDIKIGGSFAAVLTQMNCYLQELPEDSQSEELGVMIKFPENQEDPKIKRIEINEEFLLMLNEEGRLFLYSLEAKGICNDLKPSYSIANIFPNNFMTKAVTVDTAGNAHILNFLSERSLPIENFETSITKVIWDTVDPNQFAGFTHNTAYTFLYKRNHYRGESCGAVIEIMAMDEIDTASHPFETVLSKEHVPMIIAGGYLVTLTPSNQVEPLWLSSHISYGYFSSNPDDEIENLRYFFQNLSLSNFQNCLNSCHLIGEDDRDAGYNALASMALKHLNIPIARKAYQLAGNISMVHSLGDMIQYEEKRVIQGMVAMIFGDFALAQEYLMKCSDPELALDLRCDIQDWPEALQLAEKMVPDRVPFIKRHLAEDEEKKGKNQQALRLFEASVAEETGLVSDQRRKVRQHNMQCQAGIARNSIKTGNLQRGVGVAANIQDTNLVAEIAACCESMKSFEDAATLYEKAEKYERAASLYIAQKQFAKAEKLIQKLDSPKILGNLAKMKENEGNYRDAEKAYERAKDWENVIRINLNHMENYNKALKLYKEKSPTQNCASLLADYCDIKGMRTEVIKYLVLSGKHSEAFQKAQIYQEMQSYAESLDEMSETEALQIAQYFEGINDFKQAGKYYESAEHYTNSLTCYMNAGEESLDYAIEMIAKSQSELLFNKMLDYLDGTRDGDPKDTKWAFKLYLSFGRVDDACQIAVAIVEKELGDGNYKEAHNHIFRLLTEIIEKKVKVSYDLHQKMIMIHSYTLIKKLIKINENENAAKMLNRVCENLGQFPQISVQLLQTAVIQNTKAGLKASAFKWAATICRAEYRNEINSKFKSKIEKIARKPVKDEPLPVEIPCPFCTRPLGAYDLSCGHCMNNVPFCIASGKHIATQDLCMCPHCEQPAFYSTLSKMLEVEAACPMCFEALTVDEVVTDIKKPKEYIKSLKIQNQGGETGQEGGEETK